MIYTSASYLDKQAKSMNRAVKIDSPTGARPARQPAPEQSRQKGRRTQYGQASRRLRRSKESTPQT